MLQYRVRLTKDTNGTVMVTVPDLPEAHTFGEDEDEALAHASDAIETALMLYIEDRKPIPAPSPVRRGDRLVTLPVLTEAKLALYTGMRERKVGKAELARRLNIHMPQVDRLLDLAHASRLAQIESAFRVIGKRIVLTVEDAA